MRAISDFLAGLAGPGWFLELLTQVGTFAGAISGVRLASMKRFDWFGAYVIGFITAMGGGTMRDVLLSQPPFWLASPSYLVTTFLAVVAVAFFGRRFISEQITWFVFDTISISVFMVIGMEKVISIETARMAAEGVEVGLSDVTGCWWRSITMGVITAVFGGIMRDICINEVPLIFRKELYALACAAGGFVYFALVAAGVDGRIAGIVCIAVIFVIRALAIKYHLGVPVLTGRRSKLLPHHHARHRPPERRPRTVNAMPPPDGRERKADVSDAGR